jgi:hypothetical protein
MDNDEIFGECRGENYTDSEEYSDWKDYREMHC